MRFDKIQATLKNGLNVEIREATVDDAEQLIRTAKSILRTSDYLCSYEDEFNLTLEEEKAWIKSHEHDNSLLLFATYNNDIIAVFNTTGFQNQKMKHIGVVGISIVEDWRGLGLGNILFGQLIKWAKENPNLEILSLEAFSKNTKAIELYKKHGFVIEGIRKNYFKQITGEYNDDVLMSLNVK